MQLSFKHSVSWTRGTICIVELVWTTRINYETIVKSIKLRAQNELRGTMHTIVKRRNIRCVRIYMIRGEDIKERERLT